MINYFYSSDKRSAMYGLQSAFEGVGGISITFIAGQFFKNKLVTRHFIAYAIAIPVFFLSI